MDRFRRTNPSVSRIITSRMQQRQHEFLKKRLANVKSTYNVRNLKLKRVKNRKKAQMDEGNSSPVSAAHTSTSAAHSTLLRVLVCVCLCSCQTATS